MDSLDALPDVLIRCLPPRIYSAMKRMCVLGRLTPADIAEIRLRVHRYSSVTESDRNLIIEEELIPSELNDSISKLCRGSVYAHGDTIREGYISVSGGIRVGVCGALAPDGRGVREITSLNIRVPHVIRGVGDGVLKLCCDGAYIRSMLIYSRPGVGKTTLLRDLAATIGGKMRKRVALIDTRGELYMEEMLRDTICDVLVGYSRPKGIEIATRTLSPEALLCDELGDLDEARGILGAQNTGVPIIATAHAFDLQELLARPNIRMLHDAGVFDGYLGIRRERVGERLSRCFTLDYTAAEQVGEYL